MKTVAGAVSVIAALDGGPEPIWAKYGVVGSIVLYLIYRDHQFTQRDARRANRQEQKLEQLTGAMNNLVRITSIEVLSRPHVAERARSETEEILKQIPK